jgi:chaperonin GroES
LRQLLDAGTLSNLPAGFKARGARIADDDNPIQPGEWRDIDAGGAELSASLMPLPYKEPSQTLFALLGFLVEAGRRLASIADMQVGDGNQMAAVGTTLALLERGSMVMSAIHKRLHYAQGVEFRMLAQRIWRVFA